MGKQLTAGQPAPTQPVTEVRGLPATAGLKLKVKGIRFTPDLDGDTENDYDPGEAIQLQGATCEVKDFTEGDYIELSIIQPGSPDVVVHTYGETLYIKPSGRIQVVPERAAKIPAGLKIRATYHSVSGASGSPIVYLDYHIWWT